MNSLSKEQILQGWKEDANAWAIAHQEELLQMAQKRLEDLLKRSVRDPAKDPAVIREFRELQNRTEEAWGPYAYIYLLEKMLHLAQKRHGELLKLAEATFLPVEEETVKLETGGLPLSMRTGSL